MSPRIKAYIYLTLATLIWGIAAVVIKLTLKGIAPLPFLTYRFFIAAIVGIIFIIPEKKTLKNLFKKKKTLLLVIIYSFLATTGALGVLFLGLTQTTVLNLALVDLLAPLLVAIFGIVILKEHITKKEYLGALLAIIGAILAVAGPIFVNGNVKLSFVGDILLFGYILFDAFSMVLMKKLQRNNFSTLFLVNVSFIIGFITILPFAFLKYNASDLINIVFTLPLPYHLGVIFMAVVSGSLAYYLRGLGQKTIEIAEAGLFGYLISLFAAPLAIIILGETLTPVFVIGAIIVIAGIIIAENKKKYHVKI